MPVFLVEHPDAGPFLIDVGYDPSVRRTPGFLFGKVIMKHKVVDRSAPEQVSERGIDPSHVSRVLVTHRHLDHVSGSAQWPDAAFVGGQS